MNTVVVPVRYPLSDHSSATLATAIEVAAERDATLVVLHVDPYQNGGTVRPSDLEREVEGVFGPVENARYVVRRGFLVEETILEEVVQQDADTVVIGRKQAGSWQRMLERLTDYPDIERYLRERLECEVITAS